MTTTTLILRTDLEDEDLEELLQTLKAVVQLKDDNAVVSYLVAQFQDAS